MAAGVDMDDPRRALGREDDVRVDAQLLNEMVSSGSPIGVTYQIQNLSKEPIAVAEKRCEATYDPDTQIITVSLGAEVPGDGAMPRMAIVKPGEKKTFSVGVILRATIPSVRRIGQVYPRLLQMKVNVLRDLKPFEDALRRQQQAQQPANIPLSEEQFVTWLEGNDAIFLNAIPIRYNPARQNSGSAESNARPSMSSHF
jgi:hypothetical protein